MIYIAQTDEGVIVIDLGWVGAEGTLSRALQQIGADAVEVAAVFLTHTHRDHVVGWRQLRHATFVMGISEVEPFTGQNRHSGFIPGLAERLRSSDLPAPGEVDVLPFSGDTIFALGADTLRAFLIPGHTAGSAAYLFRGVLFVGDALSWSRFGGLRPDRTIHSDDSEQNRRNVASLWDRLPEDGIEWVCTAHARCAPFTADLLESLQ